MKRFLVADDGPGSPGARSRWSAFTPAAIIARTPAVSVPGHFPSDGLPIGLQLLASAPEDERLMSLAGQIEGEFDPQATHLACWGT